MQLGCEHMSLAMMVSKIAAVNERKFKCKSQAGSQTLTALDTEMLVKSVIFQLATRVICCGALVTEL